MTVDGRAPHLLSATTAENWIQRVYLMAGPTEQFSHHAGLIIQRERLLYGGALYERIRVRSAQRRPVQTVVELRFAADFADLFEVRGVRRAARGAAAAPLVAAAGVTLGYRGLDGLTRETALQFTPAPTRLTADLARWELVLAPGESQVLEVSVTPVEGGRRPAAASFDRAAAALRASYAEWAAGGTVIETDSDHLNRLLERSVLDLRLLTSDLGHGPFAVAGIPWFAVPFGRDSLLTALFALPFRPDLALGTLRTLAAFQGRALDPSRCEEPGKIPHELRTGEMANLGEVPFGRYYGSVDATPLFLLLACEYYAWTGDLESLRGLLPAIRSAIGWLERFGEGFVTFEADRGLGLTVQSWKDSHDSLGGGSLPGPVAVSEVQGYAYDAQRRLAPVLAALGEPELADRMARQAERRKQRFDAAFWMGTERYYALALDGAGQQVKAISSDIGHCLWSGIVPKARAAAVADRLTAPALCSGWGIRTLGTGESAYSPVSYHNGSVWPHDTALGVLGLKRYGFDEAAARVAASLIAAAAEFPLTRLPELFCGFDRSEGAPVAYPVACSPQAWAAATPLALLRALLGLEPDAALGVLRLRPHLPEGVRRISLRRLRVGQALVDLEVTLAGVRSQVTGGPLQIIVQA